jgi:hypothetical protein
MSAALELAHEIPERTICAAAGISRSTLRRRRHGTPVRPATTVPRRLSRRALGAAGHAQVLTVLHIASVLRIVRTPARLFETADERIGRKVRS